MSKFSSWIKISAKATTQKKIVQCNYVHNSRYIGNSLSCTDLGYFAKNNNLHNSNNIL